MLRWLVGFDDSVIKVPRPNTNARHVVAVLVLESSSTAGRCYLHTNAPLHCEICHT